MRIPDHLTCLLRNLYVGQEAAVRTGHETMDWFKIGKGVHQDYILSSYLLNFYAAQTATVGTGHGTMDWFQIGKGVLQVSILSPCLFNLSAEYIIWNAGLAEAQAGIKIAGRNINNLI